MALCLHCKEETENPKYCSRSCSAKESNKTPKRKARQYLCKDCSTPVPRRRTKCDDCLRPKNFTLGDAIYHKHNRASAYALVRSRARAYLKDELTHCEVCGYDKHVEVCHVTPIHCYPLETLLSEINSRDNLKVLCPNCHWEFDHKTE